MNAVFGQVPSITSFTPTNGPIGTTVTITGTNFNPTASNDIVIFGATQATISSCSISQLVVTVPWGATYRPISVTINGLSGYSSRPFIQTFESIPGITSSSMAAKVDFTTGAYPCDVAIADIDGDGKPDLVVLNSDNGSVSVFRNTSSSGSITSSSFAGEVNIMAAGQSFGFAVGDLDGDGKPDLVVTSGFSNTVSVLRNTSTPGSITFAPAVYFTTGSFPWGVAIDDIDGDGKPDMVVVNHQASTTSIFRNTSTPGTITSASFAVKVDCAPGTFGVAVADIDGDGRPDLVLPNGSSNTVWVARNLSSPGIITSNSFALAVPFTVGMNPRDVAIGDLDGDGKPDLVVSNYNSKTVSILRNTSLIGSITLGSFAASVNFTTGTEPIGVKIADIDGDGKPDIVVANSVGSFVSVYRNTSSSGSITSGSFNARVDFTTTSSPWSVAIGDLDGDGRPDLVVPNFGSQSVSVLQNIIQASPPLVPSPELTSFSPTNGPIGTVVTLTGTNFNPTASNDILHFGAVMSVTTSASSTSLTATVPIGTTFGPISVTDTTSHLTGYSNTPFDVTFQSSRIIDSTSVAPRVDFATGPSPCSVAIGDIDGDGKPDVVVANNVDSTISVYRNTSTSGSITFAPKVDFATGPYPSSVAIGDIDGDGKPDLVVTNRTSNTISVFRNTSVAGSITTSSLAAKVDFKTGTGPLSVAIGDVDGDGRPDMVVSNFGSNTISVFRNTNITGSITASSFAQKVDFTTGSGPYSVAMGDIDGDGRPDVVVPNFHGNSISVFQNTSIPGSITAGSFASKVDFTTGTLPNSVAIGDVDGDGKPDVVAVSYGGTASVFKNMSVSSSITTSSLAAKVDFTSGSGPFSLAIGDLDGDGKPDLAVGDVNNNTVSVLRNTSPIDSITTSSFASKVDFTTGAWPYSVAIGDLDGDGKPDLAVVNLHNNSLSVLRNTMANGDTINVLSCTNGTTSPSGSVGVNYGGSQMFTFTPNAGYHVDSVVVDGSKVDSTTSYTFINDTTNHTIWVTFAINTFTVISTAGSHGSVSPAGTTTVNYGANQVFIFAPMTGYHADSVYVDGVGQGLLATTDTIKNVTANHTIRVTFTINQYKITASAIGHGTISPTDSVSMSYGGNQAFTISPNGDYRIDSVVVDGIRADSTTSYTFINVTTDHSIVAYFSLDLHTLWLSFRSRWNIVSVPVRVFDSSKAALFSNAISSAFAYQGNYVPKTSLSAGVGYWLKLDSARQVSMIGLLLNRDTMNVIAGWNLLGSLSTPIAVAQITSDPGGIVTSEAFEYEGKYVTSDSIQPGKGYWVKVNQSGKLILASLLSMFCASNRIRIVPTEEMPPATPDDEEEITAIPKAYALQQNYPNPFNPATTMSFAISHQSFVTLRVYDMLGEHVATLVNEVKQPGEYTVRWNAASLPSGVYFYRLQAGSFTETKKLVLLK